MNEPSIAFYKLEIIPFSRPLMLRFITIIAGKAKITSSAKVTELALLMLLLLFKSTRFSHLS